MLLLRHGLPRPLRPPSLPPSRTRLLSTTAAAAASSSSSNAAANPTTPPKEVLVRDFVHDALYSPVDGYFTTKGSSIIISPPPSERIAFSTLKGYWDYQLAVDKLYKSKAQAWMTPVEIFAPHYSQAIARYILEAHAGDEEEETALVKGGGSVVSDDHEDDEDEKEDAAGSSQDRRKKTTAATRRKRPRRLPSSSSEATTTSHQNELHIYEIGGGYGTNALCILDYLQAHAPDVYARTSYTIVEISQPLAEKQQQRLTPRHGQVCKVLQQDALEWTEQRIQENKKQKQSPPASSSSSSPSSSSAFVLALEVLDNLPHDKVLWVQEKEDDEWRLREAVVRGDGSKEHPYHEAHRPLSDELIALVLRVKPELARRIDPREQGISDSGGVSGFWRALKERVVRVLTKRPVDPPRALFVPTGMARLVEGLCQGFPREHHFVFADFDSLPAPFLEETQQNEESSSSSDKSGSSKSNSSSSSSSYENEAKDLWALNAPLVTSRDSTTGAHRDHPSYLLNKGGADIFFPVNFFLLRDLYRFLVSRADRRGGGKGYTARVVKSTRFLERYGEEGAVGTATRSGYNPQLEDFLNTCFFLAEGKGGREGSSSSSSSSLSKPGV